MEIKIKLGIKKDCLRWKDRFNFVLHILIGRNGINFWPSQVLEGFLEVRKPWFLGGFVEVVGHLKKASQSKLFLHRGGIKPNSLSGVVNEILDDFLEVHQPWFLGGLRKVEKVSRESFSAKKYSLILKKLLGGYISSDWSWSIIAPCENDAFQWILHKQGCSNICKKYFCGWRAVLFRIGLDFLRIFTRYPSRC